MANSKKIQLSQKVVIVKETEFNERYPRSQRVIFGWIGFVALHKYFSDVYEKENGKDAMIESIGYFRSPLMLNNKILNDLSKKIDNLRTSSGESLDCPFEIEDEFFEASRASSEGIPIIRQNLEEKPDHLAYYIGIWKQ
tara:strand:+ start:54 stop:470 length:417 start_codon:yes stop_codon:yes gene_type:complete